MKLYQTLMLIFAQAGATSLAIPAATAEVTEVAVGATDPGQSLPVEFKNLRLISNVQIELRYATANNFIGRDVYGDFRQAYLHKSAFEKLKKAAELLGHRRADLRLHVFDALRPLRVQKILFAKVKGTPQQKYVADPERGSVHNYGFAVDLTLADEAGHELDMGTAFDDFTPLAEPRFEEKFRKEGRLTFLQLKNRKILRSVMTEAGFIAISNEWWHFDGLPIEELKKFFQIVQ